MDVCNYCYDKPARHVDSDFNYLCHPCYRRYFTNSREYSNAKNRIGGCSYCYKTPVGYLPKTFDYLCESCCYYRFFTRKGIYSVAKIKQNGRLDDSFFVFSGWADLWEELIEKWDDRIMDVVDADNFSDSDAFEIDDNLLNGDQKHYKNIIQEVLKWQYFKDRAEKEAMFEAAKEAYEKWNAAQEIDVAASNSGKEQAAKDAAAAAAKEAYEDLNVVQEIDVATSNSGKFLTCRKGSRNGLQKLDIPLLMKALQKPLSECWQKRDSAQKSMMICWRKYIMTWWLQRVPREEKVNHILIIMGTKGEDHKTHLKLVNWSLKAT